MARAQTKPRFGMTGETQASTLVRPEEGHATHAPQGEQPQTSRDSDVQEAKSVCEGQLSADPLRGELTPAIALLGIFEIRT